MRLLRLLRLLRLRTIKSISKRLESPHFVVLKKYIFEWNVEISSRFLPSFRTEAVVDRVVAFNQKVNLGNMLTAINNF